jgi:pimeloyl-ACP methyl ester carboxylesterase
MPLTPINGIDLYYELHGSAADAGGTPPLVAVAGLASDSQSWMPVVGPLAEHRRLVLFDNRGCGRSQPQDAASGIDAMAADCIALADHLGLERFDLLGHSMGGFVALTCALRHPERVHRLILANTAASSGARNDSLFADWAATLAGGMDPAVWFRNFFYWIFTPGFFARPDVVGEALRLALDYPHPQSPAGFSAQAAAMCGFDCRGRLAELRAPALALCAERDLIFPPDEALADLHAIPGAEVVVVPGQAHALHVEAPAQFLAPVLDFLD